MPVVKMPTLFFVRLCLNHFALSELLLVDSKSSRQDPVRISRPKIDKLACQAQGADIFAWRIPGFFSSRKTPTLA